jgi:hypothetical protein
MKHNLKLTLMAGMAVMLGGSAAFAQTVLIDGGAVPNTGLPYTQVQPPGDLSWADSEATAVKADMGGYSDPGGSFTIGGSGSYTVTGITVWDVVTTTAGAPTGLSLLGGVSTGSTFNTISSTYTATPGFYGDGLNYNPGNPDSYPPSTLYQVDFTVDLAVSAGSTYDFFLDGPYTYDTGLAADGLGPYSGPFLLCANYNTSDSVLWLENIDLSGTSPSVGTYAGVTGDAYAEVSLPDGGSALLLLGSSFAGLAWLRRKM